jgi:hypothetical protein
MGNIEETENNYKVSAFVSYLVEARCPHCLVVQNMQNSDVWWRMKNAIERGVTDAVFIIACNSCKIRFQISDIQGGEKCFSGTN